MKVKYIAIIKKKHQNRIHSPTITTNKEKEGKKRITSTLIQNQHQKRKYKGKCILCITTFKRLDLEFERHAPERSFRGIEFKNCEIIEKREREGNKIINVRKRSIN